MCDGIQFSAADKSPGVANRYLAVIKSISPDSHIIARLDDKRQILFNVGEHHLFDLGYLHNTGEWIWLYASIPTKRSATP